MVKKVHTDSLDPVSVVHTPSGTTGDHGESKSASKSERRKRIMWTREQMLSIAPRCKSLPDRLRVIPDDIAYLFNVRQAASLRTCGKNRAGNAFDTHSRKRVEDVRNGEQSTSAWRRKDRVGSDAADVTDRHAGQGRGGAEAAWRSRRETNDDGIWNTPSPSAAGATDGWLMPDTDEVYELGGNSNNVEAFEAMRQQARAEWAQSQDAKPVQDNDTEVLMNDLIAEAQHDSIASIPEGAPPGLAAAPPAAAVQAVPGAIHNIDVQSLFKGIPAAPPGLKVQIRPQIAEGQVAEQETVAFRPPESDMRSTHTSDLAVRSEDPVASDFQQDSGKHHKSLESTEGLDQAAEDLSSLSSRPLGKELDVGRMQNDGGVDDAMPGFSFEDMPMSHEMPRTSSPPPSSPRGSIWGPRLDDGAMGSTITSTDWTQMQEIWNREPTSKSQEVMTRQKINDGFTHEHLPGSTATAVTGIRRAHAALGDAMAYGCHAGVGVSAFTSSEAAQRPGVSESMMALASMSLLPSSGGDKYDSRHMRPAAAGHSSHAQPSFGVVNAAMRQPQQGQPRHAVNQPRGATVDQQSFEIYLKQLVANAHQQQQQQHVAEQQRLQAAVGPRTAHASSVIHPRVPALAQPAASSQQASIDQIRKLAPAFQLASAAIPQQRQMGPIVAARQQQPPADSSYTNHPQGHRLQDSSWMLRQLKGSGHSQAHAGSSHAALQQSWANPAHMQVQYPASAYDRRGQQATMQQYGAAAQTARAGLQQTHAALQGVYVDQLTRAAMQSARQPQEQPGMWLGHSTTQGSAYPGQVRPAHVQALQQVMTHRGGQYAVQSSLPRYYPDSTQPGYTTLYRQ